MRSTRRGGYRERVTADRTVTGWVAWCVSRHVGMERFKFNLHGEVLLRSRSSTHFVCVCVGHAPYLGRCQLFGQSELEIR